MDALAYLFGATVIAAGVAMRNRAIVVIGWLVVIVVIVSAVTQ